MKTRHFYLILLICCSGIALCSCKRKQAAERLVTVSILPQKYFVEQIAGDYVQVNVMVPPGMNPATCDLNTEQLRKLYDSDLCFTIGHLPFEVTHLYPILENQRHIRVINHSEGLSLLSGSCSHAHEAGHRHGGTDPHIWLSPANARRMAATIRDALTQQYPEQAAAFAGNHDRLAAEIDRIAGQARETFEQREAGGGIFLIYHPALTYFAADYGLEQVSIEDEGKEPNPAHLKELIDLAKEKNIRLIFIQSQFDSANAEAIADAIQGKVIPIDPLAENWTQEMERLIGIFKNEYHVRPH